MTKKPDIPTQFDESFRLHKLTRNLGIRRSELFREQFVDPRTGIATVNMKMKKRRFGDKEKIEFLERYQEWGRIGEAAGSVGFTLQTIRYAMETDEVFASAMAEAENVYKEKLIAHHQNLVFNGQVKKTYDRHGNLVSEEQIYPIRLIEMELKKHDAGYREKQEVAVNHSGGVLVAPAETSSIDDWEKRFGSAKDVTPVRRPLPSPSLGSDDEDNEEVF
jgi:hypothetical protein